ncbi:hypothetical protein MBGDN05_00424, partial [Thermoplasmatales archaeon SCGC AB-539-N05]
TGDYYVVEKPGVDSSAKTFIKKGVIPPPLRKACHRSVFGEETSLSKFLTRLGEENTVRIARQKELGEREEKVLGILKQERFVRIAYVFKDRDHPHLLNVGVFVDDSHSVMDFSEIKSYLLEKVVSSLGIYRVNIVIMNNTPVSFNYKIIKDNLPIYIKDRNERARFEHRILARYLDRRGYYSGQVSSKNAEDSIDGLPIDILSGFHQTKTFVVPIAIEMPHDLIDKVIEAHEVSIRSIQNEDAEELVADDGDEEKCTVVNHLIKAFTLKGVIPPPKPNHQPIRHRRGGTTTVFGFIKPQPIISPSRGFSFIVTFLLLSITFMPIIASIDFPDGYPPEL